MEWMLVKALLSLVAVLGLMAGIVFVLKKYVYKGRSAGSAVVTIDVLGHRTLTPKRSIHVLKVLNKVIVVGVTECGMTSLAEISDKGSLKVIDERIADRSKPPNSFSDHVDKYLRTFSWNGSKRNGKSVLLD